MSKDLKSALKAAKEEIEHLKTERDALLKLYDVLNTSDETIMKFLVSLIGKQVEIVFGDDHVFVGELKAVTRSNLLVDEYLFEKRNITALHKVV